MKNLLAHAIKFANSLDQSGAREQANLVDSLVAALSVKAETMPLAEDQQKKLLDLVQKMRARAVKEVEYGKKNPKEAPEENEEAKEMNAWADQLLSMFSLKEPQKPGEMAPAGKEEVSED